MDHFPPISNPYDPVVVPYCKGEYDNGEFTSFAERQKFGIEALQKDAITSEGERKKAAAFLQAWLFFGLIQETLQLMIVTSDFVTDEQTRVTTEKLKTYLHRWKAEHEEAKKDPERLDERRRKTMDTLNYAYDVWKGFDDFANIVGVEVELSIQLLGNALQHAVTSVSVNSNNDFEAFVDTSDVPWDLRSKNIFLEKRMRDQGWCPSVVESPLMPMNISYKYYLSLYGPPRVRNHAEAGCEATDQSCRATSVKLAGYKTQHVGEGCECEFLMPDMTEVCRIINDGGIPMLFLSEADGRTKLEVVQHRRELQYTALSHVWADGLGNRESNSLPQCQLKRIVGYMRKLPWTKIQRDFSEEYDDSAWRKVKPVTGSWYTPDELDCQPIYFWVDTICVPLTGIGPDGTQALAIENMRGVYSRANRVLVVDADLVNTYIPPLTKSVEIRPDVTSRITASNWQRRCWTLQEGVLAKKLWFQFANESFHKIRPDARVMEYFYDDVVGFRADDTDYDWYLDTSHASEAMKVCKVWQALKYRSTSVIEDVPTCVAILLDMKLRDLLRVPARERVRKLWSMHTAIPAGILCSPAERLEDPDFCWALSSLSDCSLVGSPVHYPAYVTPEGIVSVTLHGFLIDLPRGRIPESVIAINADGSTYFIRQNLNRNNKPWQGIGFSTISRLGIILGQEVPSLTPITDPIPRPALTACVAAMVSIIGEDGKGLAVNYLRAVSVIKKDSIFDKHAHLSRAWSDVEIAEKELIIEATLAPTNQHWLIVPKKRDELNSSL